MLVEKEIIAPATYWHTDLKTGVPRKFKATPDMTRYWHEQGNKMLSLGLTIPVPYEHDFSAHPMTPAEKLKNNSGFVKELRLKSVKKKSGVVDDVLFGIVDIQDEEVAKKLPRTIRFTSPWFNSFVDGEGRSWNHVLSHLALTTSPRIIEQAPFPSVAAALSMATDITKIEDAVGKDGFCVSRMGRLIQRNGKLVPQYPVAFSLYAGGIALGDDMPFKKKKKGGDEGGDEPPSEDESNPDAEDVDMDMEDEDTETPMGDQVPQFADPKGDVSMEELLCDLLGALGIHVDHNGDKKQFHRALYNAAMEKIHTLTNDGEGGGGNQPDPAAGADQNPLIQQEQQPMYMSLEDINKIEEPTMKQIALSNYAHIQKLQTQLDAATKKTQALETTRLTEATKKRATRVQLLGKFSPKAKADLEAMVALPGMALSLNDSGEVVDPMAQMLTIIEKGLGDMPKLLITPSSEVVALAHPTDADALTNERVDELADNLARMMGAAPEKKAS